MKEVLVGVFTLLFAEIGIMGLIGVALMIDVLLETLSTSYMGTKIKEWRAKKQNKQIRKKQTLNESVPEGFQKTFD